MITIDSNIAARFLLNDIPDHTERANALFRSAANGDIELFVPAVVFTEMSFVLTRIRGIPRRDAATTLLDMCSSAGLTIENRETIMAALTFWRDNGGVSLVDCYILALTESRGMSHIYSFDRGLDRYPGVERIEP